MLNELDDAASESSPATDEVIRKALQFPEDQRKRIVKALQASFPPSDGECELDEEWLAEIERRARAVDAGLTPTYSLAETIEFMNKVVADLEK